MFLFTSTESLIIKGVYEVVENNKIFFLLNQMALVIVYR